MRSDVYDRLHFWETPRLFEIGIFRVFGIEYDVVELPEGAEHESIVDPIADIPPGRKVPIQGKQVRKG